MNKRRKKTNQQIARLFIDGITHNEWDIRISYDRVYDRPLLQLLAIGGHPDSEDNWYDVIATKSLGRVKIYYPKTIKAFNMVAAFAKERWGAITTIDQWDETSKKLNIHDKFGAGSYCCDWDVLIIGDTSFRTNCWSWTTSRIWDEGYFAAGKFYDFVQNNIDYSVICKAIAYRQKENTFDRNINFLGVSNEDPSKLSYLTQDRFNKIEYKIEDNLYYGKKRFHTKPAKGIRKLFKNPDSFTPQDYEEFTRRWNLAFVPNMGFELKIIDKANIPEYYNENNHHNNVSGDSPLNGSCMRHKPSDFFEMYAENCDGMLVLIDRHDKYIGRALLWTMDCGTKIMDRIYYQTMDGLETFKQYARDNGMTRKKNQSHSDRYTWVSPEGRQFDEYYSKTLQSSEYDCYPYADTFTFKEQYGRHLTNERNDSYMELNSLDGDYEGGNRESCELCSEHYPEGEGHYCEHEGIATCNDCSQWSDFEEDSISDNASYETHRNGSRIWASNAIYSDFHCYYIHTSEVDNGDYVEVEGDWIEAANAVYSNTLGEHLMTNKCVQVETADGDKDWLPEEDTVWSDSVGQHLVKEDAQENSNGDWVYELDEDEDEQTK